MEEQACSSQPSQEFDFLKSAKQDIIRVHWPHENVPKKKPILIKDCSEHTRYCTLYRTASKLLALFLTKKTSFWNCQSPKKAKFVMLAWDRKVQSQEHFKGSAFNYSVNYPHSDPMISNSKQSTYPPFSCFNLRLFTHWCDCLIEEREWLHI